MRNSTLVQVSAGAASSALLLALTGCSKSPGADGGRPAISGPKSTPAVEPARPTTGTPAPTGSGGPNATPASVPADRPHPLAKPMAKMTMRDEVENAIGVGASKYGGSPDVPRGFVWPTRTTDPGHKPASHVYPLTFVAQINFAEAAPCLAGDSIWPQSGVLVVFYDAMCAPTGQGSAAAEGMRLFYFPTGTALERMTAPEVVPPTPSNAKKYVLPVRGIAFERGWSVPGDESEELDGGVEVEWAEIDEDSGDPLTSRHRVGGFALPEQYDPRTTCQGYCEAWMKVATTSPRIPKDEIKGPWRLLLQFDFAADPEIACAYDNTQFYICVSEASVRARSFAAAAWEWDSD